MQATVMAAASLSSYDSRYLLQYGAAAGFEHYLQSVADFLSTHLPGGHAPTTSNLFATPGNSAALALITRTLTRPGDVVLMEDPSYFLAHQVFRDYHLELLPVPQLTDRTGTLDLDALAGLLATAKRAGRPMPRLLYLVPTGNNPTGVTMPDADRARLVALCAAHGVTIVADDVYELLQWAPAAAVPKPLRWHALQQQAGGSVISMGSWSKILGPGLRLGWLEAEPSLLTVFASDGEVDSGGWTPSITESLVASLLNSGDGHTHLTRLNQSLARRANLLANALQAEQPPGTPRLVHAADAGYFLWVDLRGADAAVLRDACAAEKRGVTFLPGPRCTLGTGTTDAATKARVSFAFYEEPQLVEAGRRLGRAIAEYHAAGSGGGRGANAGAAAAASVGADVY